MNAEASGFEASNSSSSREHSPSAPVKRQVEGSKHENTTATPASDESPTSADSVREEGLRAFRAGDWRGATDAWSRGLRTLEYILAKEDEFDEDKKREFVAMQQSYLLNLSLSTLKEGRWAACIVYCDKALQNDPTAVKALYRKAQAQQELGEFDGALATVEKYLQAAPGSPLALSLQSQLRHMKAAHSVREKKLLQGMFRNLEHDPRSMASDASTADAISQEGGLMQSAGRKIKRWFSSLRGKQTQADEQPRDPRQHEDRHQELPNHVHQPSCSEHLAGLNGVFGRGGDWPPRSAARDAAGCTGAAGDKHQQAALLEALSALAGREGFDPSAAGRDLDFDQIARLVQMHQQLSSGSATFRDKFAFGLRLSWFGVKQFCSRACRNFCRRRHTQQQDKPCFKWEQTGLDGVAPSPAAPSTWREGKPFVRRSQRRQQCRNAASAAARRRMEQQSPTLAGCSNRVEDLDELEPREN